MSSRNRNLNLEERQSATVLYRSLQLAKSLIEGGARNPTEIADSMRELTEGEKPTRVDYIEIVEANSFEQIDSIHGEILIVLAVVIGHTRLIDNLPIDVPN
jgi:pantoate--beta-alanine ligase